MTLGNRHTAQRLNPAAQNFTPSGPKEGHQEDVEEPQDQPWATHGFQGAHHPYPSPPNIHTPSHVRPFQGAHVLQDPNRVPWSQLPSPPHTRKHPRQHAKRVERPDATPADGLDLADDRTMQTRRVLEDDLHQVCRPSSELDPVQLIAVHDEAEDEWDDIAKDVDRALQQYNDMVLEERSGARSRPEDTRSEDTQLESVGSWETCSATSCESSTCSLESCESSTGASSRSKH
jgi:hypothetical protein